LLHYNKTRVIIVPRIIISDKEVMFCPGCWFVCQQDYSRRYKWIFL